MPSREYRRCRTIASRDERVNSLLSDLERVSSILADRDTDIVALMRDSDVLFRALIFGGDAIHNLLVSTATLSEELTALVSQTAPTSSPPSTTSRTWWRC